MSKLNPVDPTLETRGVGDDECRIETKSDAAIARVAKRSS
jgi:hypothetical protein